MAIKILDPAVVGRIAAGEVVERPSSVAKELIENSIDAGATAITVEIRGGGIEYLRVTDNGCGIEPSQVAIAFENHATSKLKKAEELDDIRTLGFRGEALPSIAAVSHIEMTTRQKGASSGVKLLIDGGVKKPVQDIGCPEGTTVIMRDIFYNVPVRRTFLKKPNYEGSLVNDLVARMILGNPGVSFRFINNSKTVYHSFGDGNLRHAIFAVYGSETAEKMIELDAACGGMRIRGMIGVGEISKATRAHQAFFINGRSVRCALMTQVLEQVCKGRVTIGTYPMCALTLTIPPTSVDVNVHPNKLEVRFRDEQSIRLSAENIISQAFAEETVLDLNKIENAPVQQKVTVEHMTVMPSAAAAKVNLPLEAAEKAHGVPPVEHKTVEIPVKQTEVAPEKAESKVFENYAKPVASELREDKANNVPTLAEMVARKKTEEEKAQAEKAIAAVQQVKTEPVVSDAAKQDKGAASIARIAEKTVEETKDEVIEKPEARLIEKPVQLSFDEVAAKPIAPKYKVIGVLFNTYILVEIDDAMIMIDQHAAHERLMYEKFTARLDSGEGAAQELLLPIIVDVSPREMALITDNIDELAKVGYDVESFGDRSISLRSVPFVMGSAEAKPSFMNILGSLDRISAAAKEERADEIAVMACKAAVKAGDRLTDSEIESLITQMLSTGASPTCPHGRPVSRKLTKREIEKLFRRIQ